MSLFLTILAAGILVGSVPEEISGEIEQGLGLCGKWVGNCWGWPDADEETLQVEVEPGIFLLHQGDEGIGLFIEWVDEGQGMLRMLNIEGRIVGLGIYKREADRLIICFRETKDGRPASFRASKGECLLILNRVKPRK
jgi:hypothetical protein